MEQLEKGYNYLEKNSYFFGEVPNKRAVKIADYKFFWDATDVLLDVKRHTLLFVKYLSGWLKIQKLQ